MVAVARALIAWSQLLMLDEPSVGFAPVLVHMVFDKLREVRALVVTLPVVEQNGWVSLAISDLGLVLAEGQLRLAGSLAELLDSPGVGALVLGARAGAQGPTQAGSLGVAPSSAVHLREPPHTQNF